MQAGEGAGVSLITIGNMCRTGFWLNLTGIALIPALAYLLILRISVGNTVKGYVLGCQLVFQFPESVSSDYRPIE